jgi:predicted nucleic acid-binding protein
MILLDTNVVSEITRDQPDQTVRLWFNARPPQELFLCTPVLAELRYGIERLPRGRRRDLLDQAMQKIVDQAFHDRILPLDREAAQEFGRLVAARYRIGRPIGAMDGQIAAIAVVHQAAIATRDVDDFAGLGVNVVDPFVTAVQQ